MQVFFAVALAAAAAITAVVEPANFVRMQDGISMSGQDLTGDLPQATTIPMEDITGSLPELVVAEGLVRIDGTLLSCDEIRAMDEVELITDDSYCR